MIHLHLTPEQRQGFILALKHSIPLLKSREAQSWLNELELLLERAPILPDDPPPRERQPGAGYTRRDEHGNAVGIPDINDDIHQQLETDPLRPQVPLHMPKDTQTSEAGMSVDMTPPRVPGG